MWSPWLDLQKCSHSNKMWSFSWKPFWLPSGTSLKWGGLDTPPSKLWLGLSSWSIRLYTPPFKRCSPDIPAVLWMHWLPPHTENLWVGKQLVFLCGLCFCMATYIFSEPCGCVCWSGDGNNKGCLLLLQRYSSSPTWAEPKRLITSVCISLHGIFAFLVWINSQIHCTEKSSES